MAEKVILRALLAALGVMVVVAVVGSLDDIKRYAKIRSM